MKEYTCVLCNETFLGYGNNANPITNGLCCDKCNYTKVIPRRLIKKSVSLGKEDIEK